MKTNIKLILTVLAVVFYANSFAQVGIGINTPNASAMLEIKSDTAGILIPRVTNYSNIVNPATGLLVFDITLNKFMYWDGNKWRGMSPFAYQGTSDSIITVPDADVTINGNTTISDTLKVDDYVKITDSLNVDGDVTSKGSFFGMGAVPIGGIIMWSGTIPPPGFKLCIGVGTYVDWQGATQNIPDLRGRFIVGYGANGTGVPANIWDAEYSSINTAGTHGEKEHQLTVGELPRHKHDLTNHNGNGADAIATASDDSRHRHNYTRTRVQNAGIDTDGNEHYRVNADNYNLDTKTNIDDDDSRHTHVLGGHTGDGVNWGLGDTPMHENRPPYYVLAFIIRVE